MTDTRTATLRTTVNSTWLVALVALAHQAGWRVDADSLAPLLPAVPVIVGCWYRGCLLASARWPWLGWVLFGVSANPTYEPR